MRQECPARKDLRPLRSARIRHLWLLVAYGKEGRELSAQAGIAGLIHSELLEERPPVGGQVAPAYLLARRVFSLLCSEVRSGELTLPTASSTAVLKHWLRAV